MKNSIQALAAAAFLLLPGAIFASEELSRGGMAGMNHDGMAMAGNEAGPAKIVDPVCGMAVQDAKTAPKSVYAGKAYYFCSKEDKTKFDKDPETYLKPKGF